MSIKIIKMTTASFIVGILCLGMSSIVAQDQVVALARQVLLKNQTLAELRLFKVPKKLKKYLTVDHKLQTSNNQRMQAALTLQTFRHIEKTAQSWLGELRTALASHPHLAAGIRQLLAHEQQYASDYYVFYHAHSNYLDAAFTFFTCLSRWLKPGDYTNFISLRMPGSYVPQDVTLERWLQEKLAKYNDQRWFDHNEDTREHLLSVNLSLFGNFGTRACESTFHYFLENTSWKTMNFNELVTKGPLSSLTPALQKALAEALQELAKKTGPGCLKQIFVKKDVVNAIAYQSQPGGRPSGGGVHHFGTMAETMERYVNHQFDQELTQKMQARLFLTQKTFEQPSDAIKIFNIYKTKDAESKRAALVKRLNQLCLEAVCQLLLLNKIDDLSSTTTRLYRYALERSIQSTHARL